MKNIRSVFQDNRSILGIGLAILWAMLLMPTQVEGQVRKAFTPRSSTYTPNKTIYNLKGDFTMIGNTNLTLQSYGDNTNNSNNSMKYEDIDGDPNTFNSSSAVLGLKDDEGELLTKECTEIIYAGLYWTGRAHNNASPEQFMISGTTNDRYDNNTFNGYALSITSTDDNSSNTSGRERKLATYIFSPQGGGSSVVFRFYSWRANSGSTRYQKVTVQEGGGPIIDLPITRTENSSNDFRVDLNTPYEINTGTQSILINSLRKRRNDNTANDNFRVNATSNYKLLHKRKVKLKIAGDAYQEVTAGVADIYYPNNTDGSMYSAYAEVTDYVKQNGAGEYFVADIATSEGNGGETGYYGGWGMVVVYGNSDMKWRDVIVFDGHAYVVGSTASHELPVSGFNTA